MRARDILIMAAHNLWKRRVRSALNLMGVVVGCVVLLMTAAGVAGVKDAIHALFDASEAARQIGILPDPNANQHPPDEEIQVVGEMSDERRERLQQRLANNWYAAHRHNLPRLLTTEQVADIERLPHVESIVPDVYVDCSVQISDSEPIADGLSGIDVASSLISGRILTGEMINPTATEPSEALLDEFLAYKLGYRSDAELNELLGQILQIEYTKSPSQGKNTIQSVLMGTRQFTLLDFTNDGKLIEALNTVVKELDVTSLSEEQKQLVQNLMTSPEPDPLPPAPTTTSLQFRISGIVRDSSSDTLSQLFRGHYQGASGGILIPNKTAQAIHLGRATDANFYGAIVTVDSTQQLSQTGEALQELGFRAMSAAPILESIDRSIDESGWVVLGIAAAILVTAAIGISNTLLISVLERTPEFGILKSVGATDGTLLSLMVCEGALLGLCGAVLSIALSLCLALAGHGLIELYVESRLNADLVASLFRFSPWSMLLVTCLSILLCIAASIAPAWRAARLDPIVAMRRS
ncbi:ABC transporter permease [Aureliella helgolandensis]|uniref:Macrolide export ATP-binding/permease protein MacB n=1 Tax=Aureliella helgolandensis TaxID=2527968 RepID=A0A518G0G6_9BACT|nr:ABC transporter permease [Aureliella helgolandensis]QDV22093.1 Macrolide export ATP-binding/permease protein MacB [Aureliella helgolandensis]